MNPAGGLAQAVTHLGFLALQQVHLPRRGMRLGLDPGHATTCLQVGVDAPLPPERLTVLAGSHALMHQVLGNVETDATRTNHRDSLAHRLALKQHVQVAEHLGMLDTGDGRRARGDAGGQDDLVVATVHQGLHIDPGVQAQVHARAFDLVAEVTQGFMELFFPRYPLGHIELPADLAGAIEQGYRVAALGRHRGCRQAGRASADHGNALHGAHGQVVELGLVAGTRVDQATGQLAAEGMVQAGLVAADAGIDLVAAAGSGLVDEVRVGQERPCHRDHVGIALGQHRLGHFRSIDAVGGDQRNVHHATQLGGDLAECRTRHLGGNGRDTRFVPADAGVDQGSAGLLDGLGQQLDFVPGAATLDQVEHRQAEDDDEVRPYRFAHPADDFHRQAHAVFIAATPAVGAVVGVGGEELVDEVAFRTHDLDAVVTGALGQHRAIDEVGDLLLDTRLVQFLGLERVDWRLDRAGRHLARAVGIAPGMQDLQADLAAGSVYRLGDDAVLVGFFLGAELGRPGIHPTLIVGRDAAGDHQADATAGALGKVRRHALEAARALFEAGVHRAHQGAVAQGGEAQVQRSKQVRVAVGGHGKVPRWRDHGMRVPHRLAGPVVCLPATLNSRLNGLNDRN
ncbi:hypothetical protein D3C81_634490 [compost metagenome]